jgi:hypothetical protein
MLLEAAELYDPTMMPGNIYMLATAVMHDPVVKERKWSMKWTKSDQENPAAFNTDYVGILRAMTPGKGRYQFGEGQITGWKYAPYDGGTLLVLRARLMKVGGKAAAFIAYQMQTGPVSLTVTPDPSTRPLTSLRIPSFRAIVSRAWLPRQK